MVRMSDTAPPLRPTLDVDHPLFGLGYTEPVVTHSYVRYADGAVAAQTRTIAQETPVALVYNGSPHVVMMCTPADLDDFARGFTLSEEIVASAAHIGAVTVVRYSAGIEVQIAIPAADARRLAGRGRSLVGRTGCGLCGTTTIDDVLRTATVCRSTVSVAPAALFAAAAELPDRQRYNLETQAVHAAGWADIDGRLMLVREDVGRHNALDKLIGAMTCNGIDAGAGFAIVTSRASYELVQKCAVAGISLLAAVSRPTVLAVRLAEAAGITLAGLVRGTSANVYTHADRLTQAGPLSGSA